MQTRRWISLAATALASVAVFSVAKEPPKAELNLKDLNGQRARLTDLRGKIVVLNFWATWCGPCKAELPLLVEAEKKYALQGVVFVGASLDEPKTQPRIPEFVAAYNIGFPIWVGANADHLDKLAMGPAVPSTAFLDPEGHIAFRIQGQIHGQELGERLDWLIGSKTTAPPNSLVKHLE